MNERPEAASAKPHLGYRVGSALLGVAGSMCLFVAVFAAADAEFQQLKAAHVAAIATFLSASAGWSIASFRLWRGKGKILLLILLPLMTFLLSVLVGAIWHVATLRVPS